MYPYLAIRRVVAGQRRAVKSGAGGPDAHRGAFHGCAVRYIDAVRDVGGWWKGSAMAKGAVFVGGRILKTVHRLAVEVVGSRKKN